MPRCTHVLIAALASVALLVACTWNSVEALGPDAHAAPREAIVVYGIVVDGTWGAPQLAVDLDRYDLKRQAGAGGCLRHDRTEAAVPAVRGTRRDFAFRVPPGHYAPSPFNPYPAQLGTQAFSAPAGKVVYVGTFVYSGHSRDASRLELRRDLEAARHRLASSFPHLAAKLSLAASTTVTPARLFLCAP